jgi:Clp amino terminal domain, pathogenicity island component
MFELDIADLVVIVAQLNGIDPAAALDRLDIKAAQAALTEAAPPHPEAALARAEAALARAEPALAADAEAALTPDALAAAATRLIRALLRHQPFPAHRYQLAVLAGLQFLAVNGWQADLDPPGTALVLVEGLASGRLSPADAAAWLSPRLYPYSVQPAREVRMRTRLPGRRFLRAADIRPRAGVSTPITGFIPFTDDAREVVVRSREEAIRLGFDHPGSEHFLLALVDNPQGLAARALQRAGIRPGAVRERLAQATSQHQTRIPPGPGIPLPMRVMPRALGEAVAHGHEYIGTEHILLALFHVGDDTAARALTDLGAAESEVRGAVTALLTETGQLGPTPHRIHKPVSRPDEIAQLRQEIARLTALLRDHGIDPSAPGRQTA